MEITLQITSYQKMTLGSDAQKSFHDCGGAFGRGGSNDWVLPDPERYISSQHGVIEYKDGKFWLTDTSTNGIFMNGSSDSLGKGNSVVLKHGDRFAFGDYEIAVSVRDIEQRVAPSEQFIMENIDSENDGAKNSPNFDPLAVASIVGGANLNDSTDDTFEEIDSGSQPNNSSPLNDPFKSPRTSQDPDLPKFSGADLSMAEGVLIPEDWDLSDSSSDKSEPIVEPNSIIHQSHGQLQSDKEKSVKKKQQSASNMKRDVGPTDNSHSLPLETDQSNTDLFEIFMQAAGLNFQNIGDVNRERCMAELGGLFREVVQGLMELLRARADFKSEFRMSQTTIRPIENNPLKFSPNVNEALKTLFLNQGSGYLKPVDAITDSISDIRNHQIAMICAIQGAFSTLIHRFRPEIFWEEEMNENTFKSMIMARSKKIRAWENYSRFYNEVVISSDNAFQILFGDEFVKAYEEQISHLG